MFIYKQDKLFSNICSYIVAPGWIEPNYFPAPASWLGLPFHVVHWAVHQLIPVASLGHGSLIVGKLLVKELHTGTDDGEPSGYTFRNASFHCWQMARRGGDIIGV